MNAFGNAGRQRSYHNLIMVTALAPCWYCSGSVRQLGFGTLVVDESRNFEGGIEWLRALGVQVIDLDSEECASSRGRQTSIPWVHKMLFRSRTRSANRLVGAANLHPSKI